MSKEYKGVVFNSVTVRALRGGFAKAVRDRRIRTAVVSNHSRSEVGEILAEEGISVDVIVGGYDLSRWGDHRKPDPDLLFVAAAKMDLDPEEILAVTDGSRDETACRAAGIDTVGYDPAGMDSLTDMLGSNPPEKEPRDLSGYEPGVTGLIGVIVGDVVGSTYEHHRTTDFNFPLFPTRSKPTDDSIGRLGRIRRGG